MYQYTDGKYVFMVLEIIFSSENICLSLYIQKFELGRYLQTSDNANCEQKKEKM